MNDVNMTFDLPIEYKKLKIYPALVKDYSYFFGYATCLTLDKNSIPDAKIISMTYLEYIYFATKEDLEKTPYLFWLDRLLAICLRDERDFDNIEKSIERYRFDEKGKPIFIINGEKYTPNDFEEIRKIICEQNLIELPDENIQKEVRDSMREAREYKNKLSGTKPGSLEDYIISLSVYTGWTLEYVYGMSIRKFIKSIRRVDNLIHYKIYLTSSMSGMVEFKDKSFIKHWLVDLDSEYAFSDVSMDLEDVSNKVNMENLNNN